MHHASSKPALPFASPPGGIGDPASPYYPRPFNPTPPYLHGFPIEVAPVPITRWAAGNTGLPYLWSFEAARPGPHVALVALTHGDEISGSFALDLLLREKLRPLRGKLSLLFANWQAHERWSPEAPNRAFFIDHDMNRVWTPTLLDSAADGVELRRARELRGFIDSVDLVLDLHSTQQPSPPLLLPGDQPRKAAFALALGWPGLVIQDFPGSAPGRLRDFGALGAAEGTRTGLVVECGQHWLTETGGNALRACLRFLHHLGVLDPGTLAELTPASQHRRHFITTHVVVARGADAHLHQSWPDIATVAEAGTLLGHDGVAPIVTPYADAILVLPVARPRPGLPMLRFARMVDHASG
jgi:succinylglutamate desuccinylase